MQQRHLLWTLLLTSWLQKKTTFIWLFFKTWIIFVFFNLDIIRFFLVPGYYLFFPHLCWSKTWILFVFFLTLIFLVLSSLFSAKANFSTDIVRFFFSLPFSPPKFPLIERGKKKKREKSDKSSPFFLVGFRIRCVLTTSDSEQYRRHLRHVRPV